MSRELSMFSSDEKPMTASRPILRFDSHQKSGFTSIQEENTSDGKSIKDIGLPP